MRINQKDRPGISDLPLPEIKNKVEKLAKHILEDVLKAIPPIKYLIYKPLRIQPRDPVGNLPKNIDIFLFGLFSLFITSQLLNSITEQTNKKA